MTRFAVFALVLSTVASAETPPQQEPPAFEVKIVGRRKDASRVSGSAHVVDEKQLEKLEHDDIHRILKTVPGVYVREEDGFGLRPNIGLRGANSDRSAKVTLMEDGVLLAPAPYAASAAYFFPLTTRMTGIEVFKGPASIRSGPHTVGGAVNLLSRRIPSTTEGAIDLAAGSFGSAKLHGWAGTRSEHAGILVEGVRLQSEGFRELDTGGDTGFTKNELMLKGQLNTAPAAPTLHRVEMKLGFADERSNETYLGLTDADLQATPYRRYAASALDLMQWWRTQAQLSHVFQDGAIELRTVAYRHDHGRSWRKLSRFRGASIAPVLAGPEGSNAVLRAILAGEEDSATPDQSLMLGTNDRRYVSQGVQSTGRLEGRALGLGHELYFGARIHHDRLESLVEEAGYLMRSGTLVSEGQEAENTGDDSARVLALSAHVLDEIALGERLRLSPGLRIEQVTSAFNDLLEGASSTRSDLALLPGMGASWAFDRHATLFAGVHRGFSPVAPGQAAEVKPEDSINFEAGARRVTRRSHLELIGFFNRYRNIVGQCSLSAGCGNDEISAQFNGGAADIGGLEAVAAGGKRLSGGLTLSARGSYTLTLSRFRTSFTSRFSQFGQVQAGDELPYVPVHQAAGELGLGGDKWDLTLGGAFVGRMRDRAGSGELGEGDGTERQLVFDLVGSWRLSAGDSVYLKADNLLDSAFVASRRPFGARSGQRRMVMLGFKHAFGG